LKKALYIIGGVNTLIALAVLCPAFFREHGKSASYLNAGVTALVLVVINLILGLVVLAGADNSQSAKAYGKAFLLFSGLLLLCSFTLCSKY
jgi:hypothetical protein